MASAIPPKRGRRHGNATCSERRHPSGRFDLGISESVRDWLMPSKAARLPLDALVCQCGRLFAAAQGTPQRLPQAIRAVDGGPITSRHFC